MSHSSRLREERLRLGMSQIAFGKLGGVSKNTQLAYESGTSSVPLDYLMGLVDHDVDIMYIATGTRATDRTAADDDLVEIDEIDLRYGMGASDVEGPMVVQKRQFSREWLRKFTRSAPDRIFWALGEGDSMEPTIRSGDMILIDRGQDTLISRDNIWACTSNGFGMVKRLRPMADGKVAILSDNPSVSDDYAVDDELFIVGRVVAKISRL